LSLTFNLQYGIPFYLQYLAHWPEYFIVAEAPGGELMGYSKSSRFITIFNDKNVNLTLFSNVVSVILLQNEYIEALSLKSKNVRILMVFDFIKTNLVDLFGLFSHSNGEGGRICGAGGVARSRHSSVRCTGVQKARPRCQTDGDAGGNLREVCIFEHLYPESSDSTVQFTSEISGNVTGKQILFVSL